MQKCEKRVVWIRVRQIDDYLRGDSMILCLNGGLLQTQPSPTLTR